MSLNRVTLIGHLGQDPDLRLLPTSGQPVASFSIATDESFGLSVLYIPFSELTPERDL
jgi:single-stranded DNA-binding protein